MSVPGESRGFWRSVWRLPSRTPLRVKLITAVLALVAIALMVISFAGLGFLRSYLLSQADSTVVALADSGPIQNEVRQYVAFHPQPQPLVVTGGAVDWLPHGGKVQAVAVETGQAGLNPPGPGSPSGPLKPGPTVTPGASWLSGKEIVTVKATSGDGRYRVVAKPGQTFIGPDGPVTGTVIVALDVSSVYQTLGKLTGIDIIVSGLLLLGLAVVGVAVIRASLRPLTDIERTAEAIAAGELSRRVPDRDPRTEIGRLGRSLNTMLTQIEAAFHAQAQSETAARRSEDRMRQFVADASHELRTPLTAIRGFAEYYRQRGGVAVTGRSGNGSGQLDPADLDRIMRRVEQESARMGVLVEDMLLLARLDQQRPLERRTVDLLTLAADAVHDARVVAPARSINLTVGAGAALLVLGDEVRLRQVIGNLMSNALSHTPDGTPIDVRIRSGSLTEAVPPSAAQPGTAQPGTAQPGTGQFGTGQPGTGQLGTAQPGTGQLGTGQPGTGQLGPGQPGTGQAAGPATPQAEPGAQAAGRRSAAVLEVTDHGPGLTQEQAEHAFERFYRADQARTTGGTGLGLAIVAALVATHGGTVWVESAPGAGATFRIALPLAPEALHDDDHAEHEDDAPSQDHGTTLLA